MAATYFNPGDSLTAAFVNTIYSGGGHVHDGSDSDGHAQHIDLARDTTGILPINRMGLSTAAFYLHLTAANFVFDTDQTVQAGYTKLTGDTSSIVWLMIPKFSGTSNGTALLSNVGDVPATICPPVNSVFSQPVYATNGSTQGEAVCEITTNGQLKEHVLQVSGSNVVANLNAWSGSNIKGNNAFIMCYPV